jgi:hypothetical protein
MPISTLVYSLKASLSVTLHLASLYLRPHADGIVIVSLFVDDMLLINYWTDPKRSTT